MEWKASGRMRDLLLTSLAWQATVVATTIRARVGVMSPTKSPYSLKDKATCNCRWGRTCVQTEERKLGTAP